jgi:hypothetical protein
LGSQNVKYLKQVKHQLYAKGCPSSSEKATHTCCVQSYVKLGLHT